MKVALILLAAMGWASVASGGTSIGGSSAAFKNTEIIWLAPTNDWPRKLWVYKVVPQDFAKSVISHLLKVGSFTAKDRITVRDYIDSNDEIVFYGNANGKSRHLAICPALGFIEYHDGGARSASQLQPVSGVPDEKDATRLGLKYLAMLGIDVSDLSRKPGKRELNMHWERQTIEYTDPQTKSDVTMTNAYGVFFLRRIDGIDVVGIGLNGGVYMSFGNEGKLIDLQLSWRDLKRDRLSECPSPQQIDERIKEGVISLHPFGSNSPYGDRPQKLTVTKATVLYNGKHYDEKMDLIAPLARFEAVAENGTNKESLWFESPMNVDNAIGR